VEHHRDGQYYPAFQQLIDAAEVTLETAGAKVTFTQADVGTEAACLAFVNGAAQKFGRLDILINNAGIRKYEKVDEASAASWNEILNVNLMSYAFCAKAAVPLMRRNKGGAIVNVASVRSVVAGGGNLQYDTTKAAVAGLTRALAAAHCARYRKYARATSIVRQYGYYIGFECVWSPLVRP